MAKVPTTEEKNQRTLAIILEGYLGGEKWVNERILRDEVNKYGPNVLGEVLDSARYSYLKSINPRRLENVRKKYLKRRVVIQV